MPSKHRPNIGLLGSPMHSEQNFWAGVADAAEKYDVNLFVFLGGAVMTQALKPTVRYGLIGIESAAVLYDLIDVERMDGLITWAGSGAGLAIHLDDDEMNAFFQRYHPLPIVNYEKVVEGIPSLLTDTAEGMRELLIHMIEKHGSRRIALLRGPKTHFESNERHRAYNETLAEYGLPLDPNIVCMATGWDMNQGLDMMQLLLDERGVVPGVDFDTVVGTESQYVAGALQALQAKGIHIPDDVRLAGYNDTPDAIAVTPPITIMYKSFYEAGHKSLETLMQILEGESVPDQIMIPSELVIRRSCGCMPPIVQQLATPKPQFIPHQKQFALSDVIWTEHQDEIIANLTHSIGSLAPPQLANELANSLIHALIADITNSEESSNNFIFELESALHAIPTNIKNMHKWQSILSALRHELAQYLASNHDIWFHVETLWQQARVFIQLEAQRLERQDNLEKLLLVLNLRETHRRLMNVFDMAGFLDAIAQELPRLGIRAGYISLYEKPQPYRYPQIVPDWSQLVLAFDERGRIELPLDGQRFPTRHLIPDDIHMLDKAKSWVVVPLYAGQQQFGFALLEIGPKKGTLYTELWQLMSNALQLVLLMQERLELRLERERVEILSDFIRDAGHEFKTPLSTINANLYLLHTQLGMENRYLETLKNQSTHIQTLVESMLTMSQLDSSDQLAFTRLHVGNLIRTLETKMRPLADKKQITLSTEIADHIPWIQGEKDTLFQALSHIADNAIRYTPTGGTNIIRAYTRPDSIIVEFVDTGIGIHEDNLLRIFERFYRVDQARTDRGAGLGLSIAKRIIEIHCGSIEVASTPHQGSIFRVILPR